MEFDATRRGFIGAAGAAAVAGMVAGKALGEDAPPSGKAGAIKIVGISCSPRQGKATASAVKIALDAAKAAGANIETELIELATMQIPGCVAAGVPLPAGQQDDFEKLVPVLSDAKVRGIIIGTPVYFSNMSYLCKAFLDRCMAFRKNKFALRNKIAGVIAVGGARNGGQELAIQSVSAGLLCQEMILVGDGMPTAHTGATVWNPGGDDITGDEFGTSTVKNLGRRVAEVALQMSPATK